MRNTTELVDRPGTHYTPSEPYADGQSYRQSFRQPRTSLGAMGHWIHLAAVAAPLLIGEVIKDPEHRWRALRLASVGAALASEAAWTYRLSKEREKDEAAHAALKSCNDRCP